MIRNEPETTRTIEMARRTRERIILFYRGFVNVLTICRKPFNAKQKTRFANLWRKIGQKQGEFSSARRHSTKYVLNQSSMSNLMIALRVWRYFLRPPASRPPRPPAPAPTPWASADDGVPVRTALETNALFCRFTRAMGFLPRAAIRRTGSLPFA